MIAEKQAVSGTPTRIVGNKAIFQHGLVTDVYNTDVYRIVTEQEQQGNDTLTWIIKACDGDMQLQEMTGTVETAIYGYERLYGE